MAESMRLQSAGWVEAIKAEELQVGMRIMWNYGYTSDVVSITPKGQQSLVIAERSNHDGKMYERTARKSRLIAAYWPKNK